MDVLLEQPIPYLVCRQEVYLKNSVDWDLVRRDVKGPNWNEITRFPCPISSLNESLLRVTGGKVSKQTIVVRTNDKPWFDGRCVFAHRAKKRAYRVQPRRRPQEDCVEYRVARRHTQLVYEDAERAFIKQSKSPLANASNLREWWSTANTAVFHSSSSLLPFFDKGGKLIWSVDEKVSLFSEHFDTKQSGDSYQQPQSCDPSLVLCSVSFRSSFIRSLLLVWILTVEMILMKCSHFFTSRWHENWHLRKLYLLGTGLKGVVSGMFEITRCCPCAKRIFFLACWRV